MLPLLAANWNLLLARGMLAIMFALAAFGWPQLTLPWLLLLFGAYALADGLAALFLALRARGVQGYGTYLVEAVESLVAGGITLLLPRFSSVWLLAIIAVWSVFRGIALVAAAAALREEMTGEWPLPFAGVLSFALGILLAVRPEVPALAALRLIATYAFLVGISYLALAVRMRQLAQEIPRL
jgi:uncharacterized membrane protein HdeD (DUF308 family)